jgi:hypothetical protein
MLVLPPAYTGLLQHTGPVGFRSVLKERRGHDRGLLARILMSSPISREKGKRAVLARYAYGSGVAVQKKAQRNKLFCYPFRTRGEVLTLVRRLREAPRHKEYAGMLAAVTRTI